MDHNLIKSGRVYAVTPPNSNLELAEHGDFFFVLAQHYLNDDNYRKFFDEKKAEGKKHIILDNGGGDYEQVKRSDLSMATRMLMPNEVIPIDKIGDKRETLLELDLAKSWVPKGVEILFCPQGRTVGDFINCWGVGTYDKAVSRMALSKIAAPLLLRGEASDELIEDTRPKLYSALHILGLVTKPVHLLGMGTPREMMRYNSKVQSCDSCLAIWSAMMDEPFHRGVYQRVVTPKDYFTRDANGVEKLVKYNIDALHNIHDRRWSSRNPASQFE